jgi:hypothetical protein
MTLMLVFYLALGLMFTANIVAISGDDTPAEQTHTLNPISI